MDFRGILAGLERPAEPRGTVVFAALGTGDARRSRKFQGARFFLPPFAEELAAAGIAIAPEVLDATAPDVSFGGQVPIFLYNETDQAGLFADRTFPFEAAHLPQGWNSFAVGRLLRSKRRQNALHARIGVPTLRQVTPGTEQGPVFVLADSGHSSDLRTLPPPEAAARPGRFVTAFVDSTTRFQGVDHFVCTRLLAVGPHLIGGMAVPRPVDQGVTVHLGPDTPRDPALLRFMHETWYAPHVACFAGIARKIGDALGPGFYTHDLVPCAATGRFHVCETNLKFQMSVWRHFPAIRADVPFLEPFFDGTLYRRAAAAFLAESRARSWLPG